MSLGDVQHRHRGSSSGRQFHHLKLHQRYKGDTYCSFKYAFTQIFVKYKICKALRFVHAMNVKSVFSYFTNIVLCKPAVRKCFKSAISNNVLSPHIIKIIVCKQIIQMEFQSMQFQFKHDFDALTLLLFYS